MPQNSEYLVLGLVVAFGLLGVFAASIVVRFRSLWREIHFMQRLTEDDKCGQRNQVMQKPDC